MLLSLQLTGPAKKPQLKCSFKPAADSSRCPMKLCRLMRWPSWRLENNMNMSIWKRQLVSKATGAGSRVQRQLSSRKNAKLLFKLQPKGWCAFKLFDKISFSDKDLFFFYFFYFFFFFTKRNKIEEHLYPVWFCFFNDLDSCVQKKYIVPIESTACRPMTTVDY